MLTLDMNSKRQRRPNVRLCEVGDIPAAFAFNISHKPKQNFGHKRWKHNHLCGFSEQLSSDFVVLDSWVLPRNSADVKLSGVKNDPVSMKSGLEMDTSNEFDGTKFELNFGSITRKGRLKNRRGRSTIGNSCVSNVPWNAEIRPGMECVGEEVVPCPDTHQANRCKDFSDCETSYSSKEASENGVDNLNFNVPIQVIGEELRNFNGCSEDDNVMSKSCGGDDGTKAGGIDVSLVGRWLEELGYGRYASMFEMHEVDEEALPLLTPEDLKEIGVLAVGPRRRLFAAIQQLKDS